MIGPLERAELTQWIDSKFPELKEGEKARIRARMAFTYGHDPDYWDGFTDTWTLVYHEQALTALDLPPIPEEEEHAHILCSRDEEIGQ